MTKLRALVREAWYYTGRVVQWLTCHGVPLPRCIRCARYPVFGTRMIARAHRKWEARL